MCGCRALIRLPNPKIQKWGDKTIKSVFIGYVKNNKAYHFLSIENRDKIDKYSIIELRDTIFFENTFLCREYDLEIIQRDMIKAHKLSWLWWEPNLYSGSMGKTSYKVNDMY